MKKLFAQIVKFGIVGFTSFGIDYVTGLIVLNLVMALTSSSYFEMASLVGSVAGFTVSVIANYILSFKFVFERKEDLNKKSRIHYLRRPFPDRNAAEQLPDLDCSRTDLPGEHCTAAAHRLQPDLHHCKSFCNCGCHGVQLYYQKNLSGEEMILKKI